MSALVRRFVLRRQFLRRAGALGALVAVDGAFPLVARSQSPKSDRARIIGVLGYTRSLWIENGPDRIFKTELERLGWKEGKDVAFEYRFVQNDYERASKLAQELINSGAELILVSGGVNAVAAAKSRTSTIPIVILAARNPVKFGLVSSMSHPGGNVTGLAWASIDWGKYLELAREFLDDGAPIGVIANPQNLVYTDYIAQNEAAARRLGIKLQSYPAVTMDDIGRAFAAMRTSGITLVVVGPDLRYTANMRDICAEALKDRLAIIGANKVAADAGAVVSLMPDFDYMVRRASWYVDQILRGAKPADLPVEQPDKFLLVLNLKTAKAISVEIPQSVLLRADEVIE